MDGGLSAATVQGGGVLSKSKTVLLDKEGRVAVLTLNRPEALNALNGELMTALRDQVLELSDDPRIGCIVITGSEKAFAAGADIKEMADRGYVDMYLSDTFASFNDIATCRLPTIAAVSGYALGGGCELAMICDMIFASDTAKFGQPEIKLAVIPGIGGTQRLTRAVGKAKATDLILSGRMMDAEEAERCGLVARVVPAGDLMKVTMETATEIANYSRPSVYAAKEAIGRAQESSLAEGIRFERRIFHSLFSTHDQKEGMAAFVEKRPPKYRHE
jgi:enoyl-CoA hydratase